MGTLFREKKEAVLLRPLLRTALVACFAVAAAAAPTDDEIVLPGEFCRHLFIVTVTFGEERGTPAHLVLDTGAEPTSMTPAALKRILGEEIKIGRVVTVKDARIGTHPLPPIRVGSYSMEMLSRAIGREIDGILGFPNFRDVLLTLDYGVEEVRIATGRLPKPDGREIFRVGGGKRPHLKVEVGGRRIPVLIDSGSTGRLTLRLSDRLAWSVEPRPAGASVHFSGVRLDAAGRLKGSVQFGPLRFDEPIVKLTADTRLAGWHVLHHFTLTFDQKTKRVRMRPVAGEPVRMPSLRGSGLGLDPQPEGLEVFHVFAGTSAERAGIGEEDVIVAIDGTPVYDLGCDSPWSDEDKQSVSLSILRGGVRTEVDIDVETLVP